jgi:hypothetical protein
MGLSSTGLASRITLGTNLSLSGSTLNASGGGGSSFTRQIITSGTSATVTGGNYIVTIDPASTIAAYTLTMPASPTDLDTDHQIQLGTDLNLKNMKKILTILILIASLQAFSQSYNNNAHVYNIHLFGARKATVVFDGAMTSGSATLTSATAAFVSSDVGKIIVVKRAGTSGRDLITTIASFTNSTTVTLTASASSTVTFARTTFGIDCTTAIQNAINAADANKGGEVYVPTGVYMIGGALQTSVGGINMNSQIYIPFRAWASGNEVHITIKGETKPIAVPQGANFSTTVRYDNAGSVLYSTLTSGATDCAVIGTGFSSAFNESTFSVENLVVMVCNNPTGTGAVVGGISGKNISSVQSKDVAIIIDTTGYSSVFPSNDIAGFATPDNSSETLNNIENTLVIGFRSGFKIGEHVSMNQAQAYICYYAFYYKDGGHASVALRLGAYWCAYDFYIAATLTRANFINMQLSSEWQQTGKWYDDIATIKDSANAGKGTIFYCIIEAGAGLNQSKFSKSGGSNMNAVPFDAALTYGSAAMTSGSVLFAGTTGLAQDNSNFSYNSTNHYLSIGGTSTTAKVNITTSSTADGTLYLQNTSTTGQAALWVENNRGSFASYGGINYGSTSSSAGNLFGLTRADKLFLFADGANNLGLAVGTRVNTPVIFGSNNLERMRIFGGGNVAIGSTTDNSNGLLQVTGNLALETAGNKINIATGTNASIGTATLSGGTITVSTTAVTASSKIFVTHAGSSITNAGTLYIGTITAATSFVITSTNASDNDTVNWWIIN